MRFRLRPRQFGATLAVTNDDAWRDLPSIETIVLSDLID
jgi:hypothetical protein